MSAKEKGVDLKAAALGHRDGNVIVVNSEIQDPSEMKGKTFAIPSTQSSHYILLRSDFRTDVIEKDLASFQKRDAEDDRVCHA